MSLPKKTRILVNGFLYESVLTDNERNKLVDVITNIMHELKSLTTNIESKPIQNRREVVKNNLYRTITAFSREFPELDLSPLKPEIEELLA